MKNQEPVTIAITQFHNTVGALDSREWPILAGGKRSENCIAHAASTRSLLRQHGIECEITEKILPALDLHHHNLRVHTTEFYAPREANTLADEPLLLATLSVYVQRARFVELQRREPGADDGVDRTSLDALRAADAVGLDDHRDRGGRLVLAA